MGKVIDIFSKVKKQQKEYEERNSKCQEKANNKGYCDCDVCALKTKMAIDLIMETLKRCRKYDGEDGRIALYGGDVLEILMLAARKFYDQLEKS